MLTSNEVMGATRNAMYQTQQLGVALREWNWTPESAAWEQVVSPPITPQAGRLKRQVRAAWMSGVYMVGATLGALILAFRWSFRTMVIGRYSFLLQASVGSLNARRSFAGCGF